MMKNLLSRRKLMSLFLTGAIILAALGFTSAAAAQANCGPTYSVKPGDYLTKIARTCGVSYSDLLLANPTITNPSLTYPGQVLNIPIRIQFAPGGTSAVIQGQLAAKSSQNFLIKAGGGQPLEVTLSSPASLNLAIYGADGSMIKSNDGNLTFRGPLPKNQDYILVLASGDSAADFSMSVDIPLRIRFAAGSTSETLTGTTPANLSQYFILGAAKGQTLNVSANPDDKLQLIIYGVDGSVLRSGMGQGASFTGVLPVTQDYIVVLRSANQVQAFTLKVSIPAASTPPGSGGNSYIVQRGDTLFSIALRFETTVQALLRINPQIGNPNLIFPGQQISIP